MRMPKPESSLQDRCYFDLSAEAFERFEDLLASPPQDNIGLRRLLQSKPPWCGFRRRRTLIPRGTRTAFRAEGEQRSERSDAGTSIVQEVFGFVKKNPSGAQRRKRPVAEKGVRGKGRQPFSLPVLQRPRRASARRLSTALFPHRVPTHFEAMRVVNQAVEDAVGGCRIADLLVPARDR